MDSTVVRFVCVALLVAAVAPTGTAATPPAITLTVDGTTVDDGGATLVESDPTVDVQVDADRSIRVVSVRLDGTTVRRATPNATTFDESFDLDVASGEHTVTVVVKTDRVTTHEVTVTKDAERPYVQYTAPFETDTYAPPPESASVNRSRIVLAGNFTDVTGVSHLRIVRRTEFSVGSDTRTDREIYTASGLDGSFSQPLFLGVGRNNVTAQYYDELGHVRKHNFQIVVEDTAPPTLSNLSAIRTSPSTLRLRGRAIDNGQIQSVSIRPATGSSTTYLVEPGLGRPDPTRGHVSFEMNRTLYPGATAVVVEATDTAGNSVERTVTVRRTVAPDLRLDPTGTQYVNESTVVVRGRATDGEIASASVETVVDGDVVDITTVHDGGIVTDLAVEGRLDAPDGRDVTVRLRVIDSAGTEHVVSLDRRLTVDTPTATATPEPTATPAATSTPAPGPTATPVTPTPAPDPESSGLTIPLIGVTIPVPSVLGTSVSLPVPIVGPFDVPVVPVVGIVVLGLGAVARAR
ncbi:hypothetical protein [Haloplanus aerogenes]|uniref:Uncharacterized protein n=1 Tax=Haloplanus aerogenes TaxID=660522 RepID=A0A3M0DPB5_9EURY|nr:hypothetical protein [Haloplanus aerogenes]AZH24636.1 hypothetical protein DU502_04215 [Haloplanus aerogenes]RMB23708.1 hypothetical protein ATH50_0933 [Haloplanus aerogenes]